MAENFNLIFGSQAPTTATWTDADYQTGWSTVGSTPPTAEQFDFLQNRADLKAKELNDALTPLVQKSEADGRQAGTIYAAGAYVTVDGLPNGWLLECVVPGTSGTVAITLPDTLIDGLTIIDGTVTWKLRKVATNGSLGYRQPSTAYEAGQIKYHSALPTGWYLECTTPGTTSSGELTISSPSIGGTVSDGTVVWTIRQPYITGGGVMTGDVIRKNDSSGRIELFSANTWTAGAVLSLHGVQDSSEPGVFKLLTATGLSSTTLVGNAADNSLTWNNNDLSGSAIVAKSLGTIGYIKYASGLIIQWGLVNTLGNNEITIPFPITFTSPPIVQANVGLTTNSEFATIESITNTTCTVLVTKTNTVGTLGGWIFYSAIGY